VGSVVLPILGAVPDGVMVLFSGLGPDAQSQVSVGVGALAGSTVMLLTLPWFLAILSGSVPIKDGQAKYGKSGEGVTGPQGVQYQADVPKAAKIMIATTLLYLVIQVPATMQENDTNVTSDQAKNENMYALVGLILCSLCFIGYLWNSVLAANGDKELEAIIEAIKGGTISITAALQFAKETSKRDLGAPLTDTQEKDNEARLKKIVKPFFAQFDKDNSKHLDLTEFHQLLTELGQPVHREKVLEMFKQYDTDNSGSLKFDEVVSFLAEYLQDTVKDPPPQAEKVIPAYEEDDEEEEMPEDLQDLSPEEQLKRVLFRSVWMMGVGTLMVLIFSDPMVDVLSEWGVRTGIPAFYISFVLAPLASNASELLSAYTYAAKKSSKSITTALSTLVGAAIMNNTFCLAIFFALIYCKSLAWQFSAETIAIILIQWVIGIITITKKVQTKLDAVLIMACYPGCLFIVWALENVAGLD
jgi:Ca2+/Na+ antiporter